MHTGTVMFVIEAPLLLLLSLHCIIYWLYLSPDMSLQTYSGAAGTDACDAHRAKNNGRPSVIFRAMKSLDRP